MPANEDRLLVRIEANARQFEQALKRVNRSLDQSTAQNRRMLAQMQRDTERASSRIWSSLGDGLRREIASLAPILAGAFSAQQVLQYADSWTSGRNALAAAGVATEDLARRQEELVDVANDSRSSTAGTLALYQRLTLATSELGLSQREVLRLTSLLNKSFASSGASSQEAASAALQLSQALASGVLQGDELRALRESAPQVAQIIARSMGVSVGALKRLGAEGRITADVIVRALLGAGEQIEEQFDRTTMTVGQALQRLDNELGRHIGRSNEGLSATDRLAQAIVGLADNLDTLIPVLTVLATAIGVRYAGALAVAGVRMAVTSVNTARLTAFNIAMTASMTGATRAQVALNMAMAANPIGLIVTLIAGLTAGLVLLGQHFSASAVASRELNAVTTAGDQAIADYAEAVNRARSASASEREELVRKAAALREVTAARIADARVNAQRRIDEARQARTEADRAIQSAQRRRAGSGERSFSNASSIQDQAASRIAQTQINQAVQARQDADEAIRAWERLQEAMEDVERPARSAAAAPADSDGRSSRRSQEDIEAARIRLRLQMQLDLARARGDERAIRALEDQMEVHRLAEELQRLEIEGAAELARQHVAGVRAATTAAEMAERRVEAAERLAEAQRAAEESVRRMLDTEAELARLAGDDRRARKLEREAELARRIAEYSERYGAVAGAALAVADQHRFDVAEAEGELRDEAQAAAKGFVDILRSDNIWEEAGRRFKDAAWDGVEQLLSMVWRQLMQSQGGGGGGWASAIAAVLGGGRGFRGFRANGGPVQAGSAYVVGEKRPELFVPNVSGKIVPRIDGMGAAGGARAVQQTFIVHAEGSVLAGELVAQLRAEGAQMAVTAYQGAKATIPASMRKQASRMKGRGGR
ncbi:tape measure protein [Brevundimonas sp. 2R-24]|uniref:Tape measure protein n=1 Tax=Peiella sedimenti TaxID=3061083 RepID=A0ABT8SPB7_9CAUL|nr:tape measure protein [Caulobacteraceae bacterium XZ-24]